MSTVHCPQYINNGCGKKKAHINWPMVIPEKATPITGTALRTARLALCWRTVGKLHIFSNFWWGEPFLLALGGFWNANFALDENTGKVCPDPAQLSARLSLLLVISTAYWRKDTFGEKNDRAKSPKKKKKKFSDATHKAKNGRVFNETSTARLQRQAAKRARASKW